MKRKSPAGLRSDLWSELRPEVPVPALANEITELLNKHIGKSARNSNVAHNLAAYLQQKYSVTYREAEALRSLIEFHGEDLVRFLDETWLQRVLKILDRLPRKTKRNRPKPQTETEKAQLQKKSEDRYEWRRRDYRDGLIIQQFGMPRFSALVPNLRIAPDGQCLDILFSGGAIRMAGHFDSLENLFGVDRHAFPKRLRPKRSGRTKLYHLDAFIDCLVHLLANRDSNDQWLPEGGLRHLVLAGIIERAYEHSPEIGASLAEKLRPHLS